MKKVLKNTAIWLCHGLIVVTLFLLPSAFVATFLFSQPVVVKRTLHETKVYQSISGAIVDASVTSVQGVTTSYGLPPEVVVKVSKKVFSPQAIEQKASKLINDTYTWLNGEHKTLVVDFELQKDQQKMLAAISEELVKAETAKPICTTAELQALAAKPSEMTLWKTSCRPAGLDPQSLKSMFGQTITTDDPAETTNISTDTPASQKSPAIATISSDINGVHVPTVFVFVKYSFYIVSLLFIFSTTGLFLLVRSFERFSSHIIKPFLTTGVLLFLYAGASQWLVDQNYLSKLFGGEQTQLIEKVSHPFLYYSLRTSMMFGIAYIVLGVIVFFVRKKYYKKPQVLQPTPTDQPPVMYNKDHD